MSGNLNLFGSSILVVDDDPLIVGAIDETLKMLFTIKVALSGERAIRMATGEDPPDLILLDVVMPKMDGYEVLAELKQNPVSRDIPVIFLTGNSDEKSELRAFEMGAVDFIPKPVNTNLIMVRVKAHLALNAHNKILEHTVLQRTQELKELQIGIIQRLGKASEFKDNETGLHTLRMSHYCRILGETIGFEGEQLEVLFSAAPMHDVGKIGIPDRILSKPGKLDTSEWQLMKKHAEFGSIILGDHSSKLLRTAQSVALTHHEKWDGSGYPYGLRGHEIPLEGRIVAISDVFDALTSTRPYKEAWDVNRAIDLLKEESGRQFDPELIDAFLEGLPTVLEIKESFSEAKSAHSFIQI